MEEENKILLLNLINGSNSASLGTSVNDQPYVSMVSYSISDNFSEFYIHISQLARHTKNLEDNCKVSLMISQPETDGTNPQTLARMTIIGKAELIERHSEWYKDAKQNYLKKNPFAACILTSGILIFTELISRKLDL